MWSRRFGITVAAVPRAMPALGLAAVLALSTLGLTAPARADTRDPDARLQIHLKKVKIHDDKDWGEGDIRITMAFWRVKDGCPPDSTDRACMLDSMTSGTYAFGADDGETKELNASFPPSGFPVHAGQTYGWAIRGTESDEFFDDELGSLIGHVNQQNGWGPLGTYTERGTVCYWEFDFPGTVVGCDRPAQFTAEYEMRRAPLADLRPTSIELPDLAGGDDVICAGVLNAGPVGAGPFDLTLRVDGVVPPNGTANAGGLGAAELATLCVTTTLPTSGQHQLSATVDEARVVPEMDERNNQLGQPFIARTGAGAGVRPVGGLGGATIATDPGAGPNSDPNAGPPTDASARPAGLLQPEVPKPGVIAIPPADLQISALEVKARDGGNCVIHGDRNVVTASIKNTGGRPAGEFAVEVKVGDDRRGRATLSGLGTNAERQVVIQNVGVAQGETALQVVVDPDNKVAEDDKNNNTSTVELSCTVR